MGKDNPMSMLFLFYLGLATLMIFGYWLNRRKEKRANQPRPEIKVIEMQRYNGGNETPSDTAMLLWRLYPADARTGYVLMHPGFIHAVRSGQGKVFVFMLNGETAHVLEDGADLFPSDALVSKIRLIR